MTTYRDMTFWSGESDNEYCVATKVRARLLGMVIELGDDETHKPDKVTSFYEVEGGGNIVYDAEYHRADGKMIARWRRVESLDKVRCEHAYRVYLERLHL
jgi:hypothetical protein